MHPDGQDSAARSDSRHRHRVLAWAPGLVDPRPADPRSTEESSSDTRPLRRPDTLGELDLAIVPVSVTPPRTWRRAAWFAVGASCGVLTMLAFAAVRLAGPDRIDAFPGVPTGSLLTAQPFGPPVHPEATRAGRGGSSARNGQPGTTAGGGPGEGGSADTGGSDGRWHSTRTWTVAPTGNGPPGTPATEPTIIVLPVTARPPISAEDLVEGTKRFYGLLPHNVEAAWAMVGPRVKAQGYQTFRRWWADATVVRLREITVDADDSAVLATVHVVTTDGAERGYRFRMIFDKDPSLVIEEIVPLT
jgi:hypothetical protein